jgi:hypothetical protein
MKRGEDRHRQKGCCNSDHAEKESKRQAKDRSWLWSFIFFDRGQVMRPSVATPNVVGRGGLEPLDSGGNWSRAVCREIARPERKAGYVA